jgi:hypothetical protein
VNKYYSYAQSCGFKYYIPLLPQEININYTLEMWHNLVVVGRINDKWVVDLVGITDELKKCDKIKENEIESESDLEKFILKTLTSHFNFNIVNEWTFKAELRHSLEESIQTKVINIIAIFVYWCENW